MSVTVIVEDGTIVANANSYVSVAEASAYLEPNIHIFSTWNALSADDKAALVVWATRYLDQRAIWFGSKTDPTSTLRWPRTGVEDQDDIDIDAHTIPQQLKTATIEMARYLIAQDRAVERSTDGLSRIRVDVIELYLDQNYRLSEIPNELNVIIAGLGVFQSGGPRFARIRRA